MLARNAESLYWIGRYVERADDTARILDVSVHQLLEDATVDAAAARTLLCVLGVVPPEDDALDAWSLTELVGYSADRPASIVSSISSARENARGAREVVSAEMWECLNATWNALPERQRTPGGWGRTRSSAGSPSAATTPTCPPLKGIYSSGEAAALDVTVDMTRLA